jgi:hypothetical protein
MMNDAIKQITYTFIGTLMGMSVAGLVAAEWVDQKVNHVSRMFDQKVADVVNAPARAATSVWEAAKQAASDILGGE